MNSVKLKTSLDFQEEIDDSLISKLVSTKSAKGFIETMGLSLKLLRSIYVNHSHSEDDENLTYWREEVQFKRNKFRWISSLDYLQFDFLIGDKERVILTGNILLLLMIFPIVPSLKARRNSRRPDEMANNSAIFSWNTLNMSFIYKRNVLVCYLIYMKYRYTSNRFRLTQDKQLG